MNLERVGIPTLPPQKPIWWAAQETSRIRADPNIDMSRADLPTPGSSRSRLPDDRWCRTCRIQLSTYNTSEFCYRHRPPSTDWMERAECRRESALDVDDFIPTGPRGRYSQVGAVCARCRVVEECFAFAADDRFDRPNVGYWAGLLPDGRRKELEWRRRRSVDGWLR